MSIAAGVARRDITPEHPTRLFGYPGKNRISTGVNDPLLASAIHFRTGTTGIIILSLDLFWLPPPLVRDIRAEIVKATRIMEERILICCTHNHSGPVTDNPLFWADQELPEPDQEYLDDVKRQAVMAASQAAATTTPVELVWTIVRSKVAVTPSGEDLVRKAGVLGVRRLGDYQFISTVVISDMAPGILKEESTVISSDFPHYLREGLKKKFGNDFITVHLSAPCGDQNDRPLDIPSTIEAAETAGSSLANAIIQGLVHLHRDNFSDNIEIKGARMEVADLPLRQLQTEWELKVVKGEARSELSRVATGGASQGTTIRSARNRIIAADSDTILRREEDKGNIESKLNAYRPVEVQFIKIGDVYLMGLPGMYYPNFAGRIITESKKKCFVIALANGDLQGCFVDDESYKRQQQSILTSPFSDKAAENIVQAALDLLAKD